MKSNNPIFVLLKGNLFAQILPILFYPIITRLFSSHEFGIYSTVLAIIMTITVSTILKLDQALPIASEEEKKRLIRIGIFINIIISLIVFLILNIFINIFETSILTFTINLLIMITIFINGFSNMLIGLNVSLGNFKINARYQIYRTITLTFLQITFGVIGFLKFGLIFAFLFSQLITLIYLIFKYKEYLEELFTYSEIKKDLNLLIQKYSDFPKYLTPTSLINTLGVNLPSMLLTTTYGISYAGLYGLVTRAFMSPLYMVSISIAQPFLKELSDVKSSPEELKRVILKSFKLLTLISVFPLSIFIFNMEYVFSVIFSEEWKDAGKLSVYILPWIIVNFILSPISHTYTVTRTQHINLIFNIISIILELLVIILSLKFDVSFFSMITIFGLTNLVLSLLQLCSIFQIVDLRKKFIVTKIIFPMAMGILISFIINSIVGGIISLIIIMVIVLCYFLKVLNELKGVLK